MKSDLISITKVEPKEEGPNQNNDASSCSTYSVYFSCSSTENMLLLENASYQMHAMSLGNTSRIQRSGDLYLGCRFYLFHLRAQDSLLCTREESHRDRSEEGQTNYAEAEMSSVLQRKSVSWGPWRQLSILVLQASPSQTCSPALSRSGTTSVNCFQLSLSVTPVSASVGCVRVVWGTAFIALSDGKGFHLFFIL